MTDEIRELYNEMMGIAYRLEDRFQYDETRTGLKFGKIVNKLQKFSKHLDFKEPVSFVLGDESINGVKINRKLSDEGLFDYYITDRVSLLYDLCQWIGEASRDKELMLTDLKMLMKLKDEYIFSSTSTNDYIYQGHPDFEKTCKELLELNSNIK